MKRRRESTRTPLVHFQHSAPELGRSGQLWAAGRQRRRKEWALELRY